MKNRLQYESSPYLLQHASNPVDWYPWGEEPLEKARRENKLLIISIGYAACHWCHVMEKECFENFEAAQFMNDHFVSIKVDREERPDLDQIYMEALQVLTGSGGWPLNIIALPDGKPIFGGTYFPLHSWMSLLDQILQFYGENVDKILEQTDSLTMALQRSNLEMSPGEASFSEEFSDRVFKKMIHLQDALEGGQLGAPKFPMPAALQFLLRYSYSSGDPEGENQVFLTLDKMAEGGIYDQVGGGFARYSVDRKWKVPHFEKMLYDNGQLMSLYSDAYRRTGREKYRRIVFETATFVERELTSPEGAFYSSLDADSEGVEGKFYTWTERDLDRVLAVQSSKIKEYFSVTSAGNWEEGRNILLVNPGREEPLNLPEIKKLLLQERSQRVRPALDNKILSSWNALMIKGYTDAYRAFHHQPFLDAALRSGHFLFDNLFHKGELYRTLRDEKPHIPGFLDDYAFLIKACLSLYEITFERMWLERAQELADYTLKHFTDSGSPLLYYTSDKDLPLIVRKKEIVDNVIPSSNSQMADNLYRIGTLLHRDEYLDRALAMAQAVKHNGEKGSVHFANWNSLINLIIDKPFVASIGGREREQLTKDMEKHYIPDLILCPAEDENPIMICRENYCLKPVQTVKEALKLIGFRESSPL